jgi:hypothetical protein
VGLIAITFVATAANAFVLLGPHILELMRKELGSARQLFVAQKLFIYQNDLEQGVIELNEKLMYIFPDIFRSDITAQNAERIYVFYKGQSLTVIDGKIAADHRNELDRYKDLILLNTRALLEEKLPDFGIDVTISSVGRFQGRLAYIIGAQYPDESAPQLWVDKNTFKPFRWIVSGTRSGNREDLLEFRFFEWRQVANISYPMRIEFYQGQNLVRMIQVHEIKVDTDFPKKLFDIRYLKSIYPRATAVLPNKRESNELNEVQKALDEFKKIVE